MSAKITFENAAPLTRIEALQALDNVLAEQGVVMVYLGSQYVKAVSVREAPSEPGPILEVPWRQLPESSSFITYITHLKTPKTDEPGILQRVMNPSKPTNVNHRAENIVSRLTPFAKLPNSIVAGRDSDVLILRDYSVNVRRMMEVLERVEADSNR